MPKLKLAIDFDGVLHDSKNPAPGRRMGLPLPGAIEAVQRFYGDGHYIIIFTARATNPKTTGAAEQWLSYFGIPYHEITNVKPFECDYIIDDRAIRFVNWGQVLQEMRYGK